MQRPVLSLIAGSVLAAGVMASGYAMHQKRLHELESLVIQCKVENQKSAVATDIPEWAKSPLACSVEELQSPVPTDLVDVSAPPHNAVQPSSLPEVNRPAESAHTLKGLQENIVEVHQSSITWLHRSRIAAILLFVLLALPYYWHFLLRRIVELRQAIIGR